MNNSISLMKNEKTIVNRPERVSIPLSANRIMVFVAAWYSTLLEENVSVSRAKALVNAQCGFIALIMPLDLGIIYRLVALAWFVTAVARCRYVK